MSGKRRNWQAHVREELEDEWDNFSKSTRDGFRARRNRKELPPTETANNYLLRMVYEFVWKLRNNGQKNARQEIVQSIIKADAGKKSHPRVPLRQDPFHWVMYGLRDFKGERKDEELIKKFKVSRNAKLLNYAFRHGVPRHLLIGFILQTGTQEQIIEKAQNPSTFEDWYPERLAERAAKQRKNKTGAR